MWIRLKLPVKIFLFNIKKISVLRFYIQQPSFPQAKCSGKRNGGVLFNDDYAPSLRRPAVWLALLPGTVKAVCRQW